jgi:hypothetical protein
MPVKAVPAMDHPEGRADETDHDWLEPDDQMGLWECQVHPLTVEWLRQS